MKCCVSLTNFDVGLASSGGHAIARGWWGSAAVVIPQVEGKFGGWRWLEQGIEVVVMDMLRLTHDNIDHQSHCGNLRGGGQRP